MHNFTIETERLIIRPLLVDDVDDVYEWVSDEDVAKYMVYPTYKSKDQLVEWLESIQKEEKEFNFGYERKEDGKLIGSGGIGPDVNRDGYWAFGYNFRKDCWGKGYATEATKAMIEFAHNKFGITNVFSKVGDFRTKNELPFIITTSKFEFADCGKTIYIRTEQDE